MPKRTEHTYINCAIMGEKGSLQIGDEQHPAYFFIFIDPESGERHVVPLTEENKNAVVEGWSDIEVARILPAVAVPKGG